MPGFFKNGAVPFLKKLRLAVLSTCRFVACHPLVASVVVGATSIAQLDEILRAAEQPWLESELRAAVDSVHQRYPNPCP